VNNIVCVSCICASSSLRVRLAAAGVQGRLLSLEPLTGMIAAAEAREQFLRSLADFLHGGDFAAQGVV
jgi:hypothetical protein